jgi:hypothetical protein
LGLEPEPPTKSLVSPRTAAPRTTSSR